MIVLLVNAYGEQLQVQLGSDLMALVVETALTVGWAVRGVTGR